MKSNRKDSMDTTTGRTRATGLQKLTALILAAALLGSALMGLL